MKTSHLISWLSLPSILIACGPDGPSEFTEGSSGDSVTAGGGGPVVATSDSALDDTAAGGTSTASGTSGAEPFGGASSDGSAVAPSGSAMADNGGTSSTTGAGAANAATTSGGMAASAAGSAGAGGAPNATSTGGGSEATVNSVTSSGGSGTGDAGASAGGAAGQASATTGEESLPVPFGSLLLTEYLESGSDKAVEVSNLSDAPVSLATCELNIYFNGATEPGRRIALSGELAAGSSHVVCKSAASDLLALCQQQAGGLTFNGDDVLTLVCDGAVHDSLGQLGVVVDGSWASGELSTADQVLRRRCAIEPRTDPTSSFDVVLEWISVGEVLGETRNLSGLGQPDCALDPESL